MMSMWATVAKTVFKSGTDSSLTALMYLLVVLQLIVQDNSIGLIGLGPGQSDAVWGSADLVDDGHC